MKGQDQETRRMNGSNKCLKYSAVVLGLMIISLHIGWFFFTGILNFDPFGHVYTVECVVIAVTILLLLAGKTTTGMRFFLSMVATQHFLIFLMAVISAWINPEAREYDFLILPFISFLVCLLFLDFCFFAKFKPYSFENWPTVKHGEFILCLYVFTTVLPPVFFYRFSHRILPAYYRELDLHCSLMSKICSFAVSYHLISGKQELEGSVNYYPSEGLTIEAVTGFLSLALVAFSLLLYLESSNPKEDLKKRSEKKLMTGV